MKAFFQKLTASALIMSFTLSLVVGLLPTEVSAAGPAGLCYQQQGERQIPQDIDNKEDCEGSGYIWAAYTEEQSQAAASASNSWWDTIECWSSPFSCAIRNAIAGVSGLVLSFVGLLTGLSGTLLNMVIYYTIVSVKENYDKIGSINSTWTVVRDISNMAFIFILLYAAIKTIVGAGSDSQKLVVKVVVVAILINFSMFATMVVIDASNLLALTFYESIAPGALQATGTFDLTQAGLSNAFTQHMSLTSLYNAAGSMTFGNIITVGVMGSIILLIAAFCFFAIAIMLLVRYVLLIMVIILSPIAFLAYVLPEMKGYADRWKKTLIGQAFFAPIYFMLTWVALSVLDGLMKNSTFGTNGDLANVTLLGGDVTGFAAAKMTDFITTLVNFGIVIIFLLTSLIVAKQWANKAEGVSGLTKWATGKAGAATFGVMGSLGRNTVGRGMQAIGDSERLKNYRQRMVDRGGISAAIGGGSIKMIQTGAKKGGSSSFDVRGTGMGSYIDGGSAAKGGFKGSRDAATKKAEEYAKSQEPSENAKLEAEANYKYAVEKYGANSPEARKAKEKLEWIIGNKETVDKQVKEAEEQKKKDVEKVIKKNKAEVDEVESQEKAAQAEVSRLEEESRKAKSDTVRNLIKADIAAAKEELRKAKDAAELVRTRSKEEADAEAKKHDKIIEEIKKNEIKPAGTRRKEAEADAIQKSLIAKIFGYNYTAASQIRKGMKGKKAEDIMKDLLKKTGEYKEDPKKDGEAAKEGEEKTS